MQSWKIFNFSALRGKNKKLKIKMKKRKDIKCALRGRYSQVGKLLGQYLTTAGRSEQRRGEKRSFPVHPTPQRFWAGFRTGRFGLVGPEKGVFGPPVAAVGFAFSFKER